MSERCQGKMRTFGYCGRTPTVVRDGKHYCWQHDPERLGRLRKDRWEKRKAQLAVEEARLEAWDRRRALLARAGLKDLGELADADLRVIAEAGGIRAVIARLKVAAGQPEPKAGG